MPYTLGDLIAEIQPILWPDGEAENLVIPHRSMVIEALIDIQQWAECYQINNTQIVPQCNTLFNCGLTVTDAPRGRIKRVYVIDHINQTTGLEDNTAPLDWCSEVELRQVDYSDLDRYISTTLAAAGGFGFGGWLAGIFSGIAFPLLCSTWNKKYFPPPTDEGLATAPALPLGYHYPQSSTDAKSGRSQFGVFALKGGQIFIGPWIQSTEVVVIEWDGLKRTWTDLDIVDNDPFLKLAVQAYVESEHARRYDHDYVAAETAMNVYKEKRAQLMYECYKENEIREGNRSSMARGSSSVVPTYTNTAQTATASCPAGQTGSPVTITVAAGTVLSLLSVADANAMASSQALQQAGAQLSCTVIPPSWTNAIQTFTANCPAGATGQPQTVTIAAGTITSLISQADADQQALNAATAQATSQLVCTFANSAQTYTGTCSNGSHSTTVTIAAGTFTASTLATANAMALQSATNQVNAILAPLCVVTIYSNSPQTASSSLSCSVAGHAPFIISKTVTIGAGQYTSLVSQADANSQALSAAQQSAAAQVIAECINNGGL